MKTRLFIVAVIIATTLITACKKDNSVTSVKLDNNTLSLYIGETETLTATIAPTNATNKNVTWSSNNASVAIVDQSGKVTALSVGTAIITVTSVDGNKTATCIVTVNPVMVAGVSLNKSSTNLTVGRSETLTATIAPTNATNKNVTWSSSAIDVVTVDTEGKITAISVGTAIITVATIDGNHTATCNINVTPIKSMTMTTAKFSVAIFLAGSEEVTIDWGNGNSDTKVLDLLGERFSYDYTSNTPRSITITGDNITLINCSDNQLTSLDVSKNTALKQLSFHENQLMSLDVSKNTALSYLSCNNNQLTSLDLSKNIALSYLSCSNNQLTSLDLSKNTALEVLDCSNNPLTNLDVSKNTKLLALWCVNNQLTSLDVSKNTALALLDCSLNLMQAPVLNALFLSLPPKNNSLCTNCNQIFISGNPGEDTCDETLLPEGWGLWDSW